MKPSFADLDEFLPAHLFDLSGQVTLVTGAAGGIGCWLAAGLVAAGATVLVTDRDPDRLEEVASALKVDCLVADLTNDDEVNQLMKWANHLDVLINCAGINHRKAIDDVEPTDFDDIMAVNLRAPYFLSQRAAREMAVRGGGSIIHVGSINSAQGLADVSVYGASKAALTQLARVQSIEWAERGVRVNCLAPGFMRTPLSEPLWGDQQKAEWILSRVPQRRAGSPSELIGAILLLASRAGTFITGQTLYVDGGFLAGSNWNVNGSHTLNGSHTST